MTETPFCGIRLLTLPGEVMSPRPATEALVDAATERIGNRPALVADVGTGSGAIAVALALRPPHARLWATDTSPAAVALARKRLPASARRGASVFCARICSRASPSASISSSPTFRTWPNRCERSAPSSPASRLRPCSPPVTEAAPIDVSSRCAHTRYDRMGRSSSSFTGACSSRRRRSFQSSGSPRKRSLTKRERVNAAASFEPCLGSSFSARRSASTAGSRSARPCSLPRPGRRA
jgi:hypothetical protein